MNAVRVAYVVAASVESLFLLTFAAVAPVWITPGYYWWTGVAAVLFWGASVTFTARLNQWEGMGKL